MVIAARKLPRILRISEHGRNLIAGHGPQKKVAPTLLASAFVNTEGHLRNDESVQRCLHGVRSYANGDG